MGQYYYSVILDSAGKIVVWMNAFGYNEGVKLMEHSHVKGSFVNTFEFSLSPEGAYYKSRVVWAGDYADKEPGQETNLHEQCNANESSLIRPDPKYAHKYRYIVNHTKKQYVDKLRYPKQTIHPLPLLTAEGNGRGGGDIYNAPPFVGSWARDIISVEETITDIENFQEVDFNIEIE
jgi:hypothetical protein